MDSKFLCRTPGTWENAYVILVHQKSKNCMRVVPRNQIPTKNGQFCHGNVRIVAKKNTGISASTVPTSLPSMFKQNMLWLPQKKNILQAAVILQGPWIDCNLRTIGAGPGRLV
jgi:hypothetical protein